MKNLKFLAIGILSASCLLVVAARGQDKVIGKTGDTLRSRPAFSPWIIPPIVQANPAANGDISVSNTEVTKLMDLQMKEYFRQRDDDRKFLENSLESIDSKFRAFVELITIQFANSSEMSLAGQPVSYDTYFKMRTQFRSQENALRLEIQKLGSISQGSLPSALVQVTEKTQVQMPAWRSLNMTNIMNYYTQRLDSIVADVPELQFKVLDGKNIPTSQNLVKLDLTVFSMMSQEEADKRQKDADNLKKPSIQYVLAVNALNTSVKDLSKTVTDNFGKDERYHWRNDEDLKARSAELNRFAEGLWFKSFLRVLYGIPTGGIPIRYKKEFFSIEEWTEDPLAYTAFGDKAIMNQAQLDANIESSRKSFQVASKRISSIFTGNFNPFTNLNTFLTFARGYKPQMEVAVKLLELVAADTFEESLTYSAQSVDQIKDYYKRRYYTDEATKKDIIERQQKYLAILQGTSKTSMTMNMGSGSSGQGAGSIESAGISLFRQMRLFEGNYKAAMVLQASIDEFNKLKGEGASIMDERLKGLE